jgi:hypothetical protein
MVVPSEAGIEKLVMMIPMMTEAIIAVRDAIEAHKWPNIEVGSTRVVLCPRKRENFLITQTKALDGDAIGDMQRLKLLVDYIAVSGGRRMESIGRKYMLIELDAIDDDRRKRNVQPLVQIKDRQVLASP